MALLINKQITILGELTINSIYIRLSYNVDKNGISVRINSTPFLSKISFKNNSENILNISNLPVLYKIEYNREGDGEDLLNYIHNYVIEKLTKDVIVDIPQLNELGEQILVPTIVTPKFCDISEISIVDI